MVFYLISLIFSPLIEEVITLIFASSILEYSSLPSLEFFVVFFFNLIIFF